MELLILIETKTELPKYYHQQFLQNISRLNFTASVLFDLTHGIFQFSPFPFPIPN